MSTMGLDLHVGEVLSFSVGEATVRIRMERKSGQVARLAVEADAAIQITLPRGKRGIDDAQECVPEK